MNHDETMLCFYCNNSVCDCVERIECTQAGEIGHLSCGWCTSCKLPEFECGCRVRMMRQSDSKALKFTDISGVSSA